MTVTIGRRELLVALGGAAVAWPLSARMGSLVRCTCPVHILEGGSACLNVRCARLEFQRDKRPSSAVRLARRASDCDRRR